MTVPVAVRPAGDFDAVVYEPLQHSFLTEDAAVLRQRFVRDGYLCFPQGLAESLTAPVLQGMLDVLRPHIVWDHTLGAPVLDGEPFFESDPLWDDLYPHIQALEPLHQLFHSDAVRSMMQAVAGSDLFVYPMKMARIATPQKLGFETPPHQDAHSHHTGPSMAGIWVGLHDAGESSGRLTLLPGSHRRGVRPVHRALGVGGVQCEIYADETTWHVSDVQRGDVIIFHAQTVHRAQPNTDARRVRLSVDTRFCPYGAPVFSTNLAPHHGWGIDALDWDFVYRSWDSSGLQYYWKDYPALF